MPDKTGKLTDDERQKIAESINAKVKIPNDECLVCGAQSGVADSLFQLTAYGDEAKDFFLPVVAVICDNCGFTRLFHVDAVGIEAPGATAVGDDAAGE